ncbi:MAG: DUF1353 domain-containing protein [Bacteroidales bacterium]|jgi:hypothetical protein
MMPGRFHGTLRTTYINKDWIRSHQCPIDKVRFSYTTSDGRKKCLPDHFLSDGGSIPRIFQNIVRRDELMPAWILHDRDYAIQDIPRDLADYDLSEMIYTLSCGYSWIRRGIIWALVHSFGSIPWKYNQSDKRKAQIAAMKKLVPVGDLVFGE